MTASVNDDPLAANQPYIFLASPFVGLDPTFVYVQLGYLRLSRLLLLTNKDFDYGVGWSIRLFNTMSESFVLGIIQNTRRP